MIANLVQIFIILILILISETCIYYDFNFIDNFSPLILITNKAKE